MFADDDGPARIIGKQDPETCPDCAGVIPKRLEPLTSKGDAIWVLEEHDCEARRQRVTQEKAEKEARERELRANPSERRVAALRARANLPWWTPVSVDQVTELPAYAAALARIREHRDEWLAGRRPVRGLWLYGRTSLRKTCCTAALAAHVANWTDRPVWFQNVADLMEQKANAARNQPHKFQPEKIEQAQLLVLDDLFTAGITEPLWKTLYGITERASSAWGCTAPPQTIYCSSNESPEAVRELLNARLGSPERENPGDRLIRRLTQICKVVSL